MSRLIDECQIVSGFVPVDMQTAANDGDVVCMKNYNRLTVIFFKGIGTAADDPVLTFTQATEVAYSTSKALATITEYWSKQGTQTGIGTFTRTTQAAGSTVTLDATSAESEGLYIFEIVGSDLDEANSYDCVRVSVADVGGNPQLGAMLYLLSEPRFAAATMPSAIID